MVDISLELPDEVIADYHAKALAHGCDAEELMRRALETYAAGLKRPRSAVVQPIEDEPIVKAAEIEQEYRRLGYRHGWRFITCPQAQAVSAKLLLVSLNPAGRTEAWACMVAGARQRLSGRVMGRSAEGASAPSAADPAAVRSSLFVG